MKRTSVFLAAVLAVLVTASAAYSQYDFFPFSGKPNAALRNKIKNGILGSLFIANICTGAWEQWATSFRKAEGKAPKVKPIDSDDGQSHWDNIAWQGMYSAYSAQDKKPRTAWVEGAPGDGIGEMVVVRVDTRKSVKIWAGLCKSPQAFKNNNRPKDVCIYVLEGKSDPDKSTESGDAISGIRVVAEGKVTLKDVNGYQQLKLPAHPATSKNSVTLVAVEILSVYPGSKYRDTAISEICN